MRVLKAVALLAAAILSYRPSTVHAQAPAAPRTRNVILVMTDGFRWQEVFNGADAALMTRAAGQVGDTALLRREFWRDTPEERRRELLPFLWGTIATRGQIFGDSANGSVAQILNPLKFSYPGYSETFTGHVDARINSNAYPPNPNTTVFEWLNSRPAYRGKVAAFATWNAFTRIINAERSGVPVFDGWERGGTTGTGTTRERVMREMYATTSRLWRDNAWDALMHTAMMDYLDTRKPRVLFIGYGETDEWAHGGRYDMYLRSAHQVDAFLAELWAKVQADPQYRDRTTLIVTRTTVAGTARSGRTTARTWWVRRTSGWRCSAPTPRPSACAGTSPWCVRRRWPPPSPPSSVRTGSGPNPGRPQRFLALATR